MCIILLMMIVSNIKLIGLQQYTFSTSALILQLYSSTKYRCFLSVMHRLDVNNTRPYLRLNLQPRLLLRNCNISSMPRETIKLFMYILCVFAYTNCTLSSLREKNMKIQSGEIFVLNISYALQKAFVRKTSSIFRIFLVASLITAGFSPPPCSLWTTCVMPVTTLRSPAFCSRYGHPIIFDDLFFWRSPTMSWIGEGLPA